MIFNGARISQSTIDWIVSSTSADMEVQRDMILLRNRARDLAQNSPSVTKFLDLLKNNVVGPYGPTLQGQIRDASGNLNKTENDALETAYLDFRKRVSSDGKLPGVDLDRLAIGNLAIDGEIFVRKIKGYPHSRHRFALQLIDPDQVDHNLTVAAGNGKNEIRMGIEIDSWERPVAYHVFKDHPTDITPAMDRGTRTRIDADEIIHVFIPLRANQTRGVSWLAPVVIALKMVDGYSEAEVTAARLAACKMGFFIQEDPEAIAAELATSPNGPPPRVTMDATPSVLTQIPYGMKFQEWDPEHPNAVYPDFIKAQKRDVSAGIGASYNCLADDLEGVNFSSMRFGMRIERDHWRALQGFWDRNYAMPITGAWLEIALLAGTLKGDRDPAAHGPYRFMYRGWEGVDPLSDMQADVLGIKYGLTSRTRILAERGVEYEEIVEQLIEEEALAAGRISIMETGTKPPLTLPPSPDNPASLARTEYLMSLQRSDHAENS